MPSYTCRSEPISARVSPLEKTALLKIAEMEQLNLSEAQRLVIREAAKRRGIWPISTNGNELQDES